MTQISDRESLLSVMNKINGLFDDVADIQSGITASETTTVADWSALQALTAADVAVGSYVRVTETGATYQAVSSGQHLATAGGLKLLVLSHDIANVKHFGAKGDGVTDDTDAVQAAIDYCTANAMTLVVPGGPYLISTINVTCHIIGTIQNRFSGGACTFTSAVGAGTYAVRLTNYGGRLENVTVRNTGAGNGIDCVLVGTATVLKDVSTSTTYPRVTGSGSIGVNFGSDANPGHQAITGTYDVVNSRDYDICFRMRYYSNSNTYKQLYALVTDNSAQPATAGFLVNGRSATFIGCNAESNMLYFLDEQGGSGGAEENTYINFWAEGVAGGKMRLGGAGSMMINPYGFVGGAGGSISIPIEKSAYATVLKRRGPFSGDFIENFHGQGENLVRNAEFANGIGGLNWGAYAVPSGNTIFGHKSVSIQNAGAATSVTADHLMSYVDLNVHTWLRGKTVSMACFGVAESGVNMSLRGVIRTAGGSNIQYATSGAFPAGTAELRGISFTIPTDPADARYLVFRIYATGVTSGTPSKAGEIAMPMVWLGNRLDDVKPKALTDGANTVYGNMTFNTGFPVVPSYTVATLPTAVAGGMIYVSDETGGKTLAFSDGTNWRRVSDRAVVA